MTESETTETVPAHVIPWEVSRGIGGVSIDLPNGQSISYEVGDKAARRLNAVVSTMAIRRSGDRGREHF